MESSRNPRLTSADREVVPAPSVAHAVEGRLAVDAEAVLAAVLEHRPAELLQPVLAAVRDLGEVVWVAAANVCGKNKTQSECCQCPWGKLDGTAEPQISC